MRDRFPDWPWAGEKLARDRWRTTKRWRYLTHIGVMWESEPDHMTDGSSIPAIGWMLVGAPEDHMEAGTIHDDMCRHGAMETLDKHPELWDMLCIGREWDDSKVIPVVIRWFDWEYRNAILDAGTGKAGLFGKISPTLNANTQFRFLRLASPWRPHR